MSRLDKIVLLAQRDLQNYSKRNLLVMAKHNGISDTDRLSKVKLAHKLAQTIFKHEKATFLGMDNQQLLNRFKVKLFALENRLRENPEEFKKLLFNICKYGEEMLQAPPSPPLSPSPSPPPSQLLIPGLLPEEEMKIPGLLPEEEVVVEEEEMKIPGLLPEEEVVVEEEEMKIPGLLPEEEVVEEEEEEMKIPGLLPEEEVVVMPTEEEIVLPKEEEVVIEEGRECSSDSECRQNRSLFNDLHPMQPVVCVTTRPRGSACVYKVSKVQMPPGHFQKTIQDVIVKIQTGIKNPNIVQEIRDGGYDVQAIKKDLNNVRKLINNKKNRDAAEKLYDVVQQLAISLDLQEEFGFTSDYGTEEFGEILDSYSL